MDDVYTKIQVYLIKKDKESEPLKFLTSRTTDSNNSQISKICETIKNILQNHGNGEKFSRTVVQERCIEHFKFLLLNTNFKVQEYLCEDIVNGHLVDMCPPLSPYLFIEILWTLNYDEILWNSLIHIPVDLCTEILDTLRKSLHKNFWRGYIILLNVIIASYKKLVSLIDKNTQILDKEESLKKFAGSIQELLSLLTEFPLRKTDSLSQLSKYERCGWVLINLLNAVKACLACKKTKNLSASELETSEKLYKLTFGRNFEAKLDPGVVAEVVDLFSQEFVDLLLCYVKKIDCNVYLGWAELDYMEDASISMQRAVGLACYHFVEFLKNDYQSDEYSHVIECLQQISSQPDTPSSMSLRELCTEVDQGNSKCLNELITRWVEWDSEAISCLDKNCKLIGKNECSSLLNSAAQLLKLPSREEELCAHMYNLVAKILLGQKLVDVIEIVVEFILFNDASNALESSNFEHNLMNYVNQGEALCSNKISLRIILFFIIQNPRATLKTLVKVIIGYPEYKNGVMLPEDLCKLFPILQIRDANNLSLFTNTLKSICDENIPWNSKKFFNFTEILLEKNVLSADEIINDIFIPCLKNYIILINVQTILTCIRTINCKFTLRTKKRDLLYVLVLQMIALRKNNDTALQSREEVLNLLIRTIQQFTKKEELINSTVFDETVTSIEKFESILEPLDQIYFAPELGWLRNEISLDQLLEDYKKRCYYVMNDPKEIKNRGLVLDEFLIAHDLQTEKFLQYLILRCTEFEYLKFAKEILIMNWNYFGWKNEVDAYAQLALVTVKACNYYSESFDAIFSRESLAQKIASLIKSLGKLTAWFINIDIMNDYEYVHKGLVTAIKSLNLCESVSSDLVLESNIKDSDDTVIYSYETVSKLVENILKLTDQYSHLCNPQSDENIEKRKSISALQFYINWTFISICLNCPTEENSIFLSKIDKKIYYYQSKDGVQTNVSS